ncbi:MAG: isochorismate synthase [Anaerolineae bacterium]
MDSRLVSYSQRIPHLDPALFLRQSQGVERFYWHHQDAQHDETVYAGAGIAAEFTAWGDERFRSIRDKAADLFANVVLLNEDASAARPRLFGGFSFRSDFVTENTWAAFAPAYFVLPHYQLTQVDNETWLTINVQVGEGEDFVADDLRAALEARNAVLVGAQRAAPLHDNPLSEITYPMSFDAWADIITDATDRMKAGDLQKVVLSRVCELRFEDRVDIDSALDDLRERYGSCYVFLFEPSPHLAFYGATPELLVRVEGRDIETMALAGSIRRGATAAEDEALAHDLLDDPKNRQEHAFVADAVRARLAPLTASLDIPAEPGIMRLTNIQHLYTPVRGTLKTVSGVLPLVETLHPTPAMGGVPQAKAMDYIARAEPVPRGWYASPVGWIDHNLDGAFAVAIRSAISQNERVWLYAGAGIVADSDPQKEWDETALKFKPMLHALGAETYARA